VACGSSKLPRTSELFTVDPLKVTVAPPSATTSRLTYRRLSAERLVIDGTLDGRVVHLELKQRDLNSFVLNTRGFNWVQEVKFNR
jgi:hypothetical protein